MLLALILSLSLAPDRAVSGLVQDSLGGAIPGATVVLRTAAGAEQRTLTGPDGRFTFGNPPEGAATLIVRAGGFAIKEQPVSGPPGDGDVDVVLLPATILETVTVTPTRGAARLGDVAASVSVIDRDRVRQSSATVADDVLRQLPTFSLFTRASSLSANPTSQGVSLRGIGPSGVSRTLVMADGVPQNDPFGGWVYWTRVPLASVDRIEVVDGSTSNLYGNYAMGGVINIIGAPPARRTAEFKAQYGNNNSPKGDLFASDVWGKLAAAVDASAFNTEGFPIVAAAERGIVDDKSAVNFRNADVRLTYSPTGRVNMFLKTGYFHENRDNGKHSTTDPLGTEEQNHTTWKFVNGGARLVLPDGSDLQATLFSNVERYFSNFLAVPAPTAASPVARSLGRMTLNQTVPTSDFGGMVQWSRTYGSKNYLSAGTDWHWVDGESQEDGLDAVTGTSVTLHRVSGGTQQSEGLFAQDIITATARLTVTLGARLDHWRNYDAHNLENTVSGGVLGAATVNNNPSLPSRTDTVGTPRAAAVYQVTDRVSVWGDVSSGFRAPTLNELYRQFKKGTTTTLANYTLVPERLVAGEGGVNVAVASHLTVRATGFTNRVSNPVTNVTITTPITPASLPTATATCTPSASQICVQRQNVGRTVIEGIQTDVEYRLGDFRVTAAYLHESAKVRENTSNTALVGNVLPEVPKNRGSVQIAYANRRIAAVSLDVQAVGAQFDDDLNTPTRVLPSYKVANASLSRAIGRNIDVYVDVQNMFNVVYNVATLPTTIGSPRLINGGIRVRFSGQ